MLQSLPNAQTTDIDPVETAEWIESLEDLLHRCGKDRVRYLLTQLQQKAYREGVSLPMTANTPYVNTIPIDKQPRFPGIREIERRIKSIIRWNAMAMVVRAGSDGSGVGGHISTYASAATLLEIGFNHFFRGPDHPSGPDLVYFQGHASPGIYARAFLEGRLTEEHLTNFRRELRGGPGGGLSSYPHPWLMPEYWQFPTVSMGLGPITAIYHARFLRYLEHREIKDTSGSHVWCFVGDGEVDEPETLGALTLASREKLDNLIFVVNCNLQRLDGPVRGNGKIIQELEAAFRGAGWNVIKVVWGDTWDPLLAKDQDGLLVKRMGEVVDGQYQKYTVESGDYIRKHFFGVAPELLEMVESLSDEQLNKMRRGGHDPEKVYAAYKAAVEHTGAPTVVLAKTIKGYGLGEAGEGKNVTHQQKKLNEEELREFRSRFGIPIADERIRDAPFYRPPDDSQEIRYLRERRRELGGYLPSRRTACAALEIPARENFLKIANREVGKEVSTTFTYVNLLRMLCRDKNVGKYVVPIVPDESRTFGMEGLFKTLGIYASTGQLYEPVDAGMPMYYREARDGQILEEGINEAGSMSSFIAAGTAYANHGVPMIPLYIYYSMFGFQRVGDLIWAAADSRARGFLLGGTAGRTSLNGEGLQHQDGHSLVLASTVPTLRAYDPAYAYEVAVIFQDGLRRMYAEQEPIFYYLSLFNDPCAQAAMPAGVAEGILEGMYRFLQTEVGPSAPRVTLFGSGPILAKCALRAQSILEEQYGISSDLWSVTSYNELRRNALAVERWNRLHPNRSPRVSYLEKALGESKGPIIAASDNVKLVPEQIHRWVSRPMTVLGTDGFGRSESREALRRHFEIDAAQIVFSALVALQREGAVEAKLVETALRDLDIEPEKADPASA